MNVHGDVAIVNSTSQTQDSTASQSQTLTRAAVAGKSHYITAIEVTIGGAVAANDISITLQDGVSTVWKELIGSGSARGERVGIVFYSPIKMTAGNAANLVIAAGGSGVITTANLAGYTS